VCASDIVFSRSMLQEHQKTLVLNEDLTQDTTLAVQYDCKR